MSVLVRQDDSSESDPERQDQLFTPTHSELELQNIQKYPSISSQSQPETPSVQSFPQIPPLDNQNNDSPIFTPVVNQEYFQQNNNEDIVRIENAHKTYLIGVEGVAALRGVSLQIKRGEFVCILGTSGGGKTTMLNIMGTIDKPTKGHIWLCGHRIKPNSKDSLLASLRLNKISFVFQTFNLVSSMTALENVELPMMLLGQLSRAAIRQRAKELLSKVNLSERYDHFPNQLSGGEQQRVTIARALANNPEILLLDEPTGDLDTKSTDMVMKILVDLHSEGHTLIMVTHDVSLKSFTNRVIRVLDGKIMRIEDTTDEERMAAIQRLGQGASQLKAGTNQILSREMGRIQYRQPKDYPAANYHRDI